MPRTRSLGWSELKIGIVGAIALLLAGGLIITVGGEGGYAWQRYPLKAQFDNVQGLKEGAVVRLNGKEIGTVTGVEFVGSQIEVYFEVLRSLRPILTTESVAQIGALSLLGEPIIDITAGQGGTPLEDNAYVRVGATPASFADMSSTATNTLQQVDSLLTDIRAGEGTLGRILTDDALYTEMQSFMAAAGAVTRSIQAGEGTIGGLLRDPAAYQSLKTSLDNLQAVTARINKGEGALGRLLNDEKMAESLSAATGNLADVTGRLSRGEGTAGRLLTDQQLYDRLTAMTTSANEVTEGLAAGRGTAGQLLRDQALYDNMNQAVVEFRDLLAEIRKDPRKYLRVNVSIF